MAFCQPNPVLDLPITIGSYPIQGAASAYIEYPHLNNISTNNVILQQPSAPQLLNQDTFSTYPVAASAPFPIPNYGKIKL